MRTIHPNSLTSRPAAFRNIHKRSNQLHHPIVLHQLHRPLPFTRPTSQLIHPSSSHIQSPHVISHMHNSHIPLIVHPAQHGRQRSKINSIRQVPRPRLHQLHKHHQLCSIHTNKSSRHRSINLTTTILHSFQHIRHQPSRQQPMLMPRRFLTTQQPRRIHNPRIRLSTSTHQGIRRRHRLLHRLKTSRRQARATDAPSSRRGRQRHHQ